MSEEKLQPGLQPPTSDDDLDRRIVRGSGWVAVSHGGRQGLAMLSVLVLVRLLDPEAFGLVALAMTFLLFVQHVQGAGMGSALIHRRTDIERAAGSALAFGAVMGLVLYGLAFLAAPFIARAFDAPELTDVLRVLALIVVIRGLAVGPTALLDRELNFRARAKSDLAAGMAQITVSVGLAFAGFGVWSLVFGHLAGNFVASAMVWLLVPWRPSPRQASLRVLRELFRYGRFVSANTLVVLFLNTVDNLLVGRLLGTTALGFYSVTYRLALFPNNLIGQVVGRVMFPVYSMLQDDISTFRRIYIQNLQRIALLALPVSVTLAVAAEPVVLGLMGEKWLPVVTPLRILAVYGLVKSFVAPCGEVFKGAGKPHIAFWVSLPHAVLIGPALYLLIQPLQLTGAALGMLLALFTSGVPAFILTMRLLEIRPGELARALTPSALCSAVLGAALTLLLPASGVAAPAVFLLALLAAGVLVYLAATAVFARKIVLPMWVSLRGGRG